MAAFDTTRPTYVAGRNGFGAFFASMIAAFATWNDSRKTRAALSRLSDQELDDIGLVRGDIDAL